MTLIENLESASEGSAALDRLIALELGWYRIPPSESKRTGVGNKKHGGWVDAKDCRDGKPIFDSLHGTEVHRDPPRWTTSIDAKLPDENIVSMAWHEIVPGEALGEVCEAWHMNRESGHYTMGAGHTEALARRIAALKAKEAQ